MKPHYYNEFCPSAAAWLRELIRDGLIPDGDVDERSITEVSGSELVRYTQCHFFAGVSGFGLALRLAGWPEDRPCWTGSCPCPPFSTAGKKKNCPECGGRNPVSCPRRTGYFICVPCGHAWVADGRHLWPEFWRLIAECRPPVVFGEQVGGTDGRVWLAGVRASLEILRYRCGATDMPAASAGQVGEGWVRRGDGYARERVVVGAPHIRQRIFWLADTGRGGVLGGGCGAAGGVAEALRGEAREQRVRPDAGAGGGVAGGGAAVVGMADAGRAERRTGVADGCGVPRRDGVHEGPEGAVEVASCGGDRGMADSQSGRLDGVEAAGRPDGWDVPQGCGPTERVADAQGSGRGTRRSGGAGGRDSVEPRGLGVSGGVAHSDDSGRAGSGNGGATVSYDRDGAPAVDPVRDGADGRMADTDGGNARKGRTKRGRKHRQQPQDGGTDTGPERVGNPSGDDERRTSMPGIDGSRVAAGGSGGVGGDASPRLGVADGGRRGEGHAVPRCAAAERGVPVPSGAGRVADGVGNPVGEGLEGHAGDGDGGTEPGRLAADAARPVGAAGGSGRGFWADYAVIKCRDGKHRRVPASSVGEIKSVLQCVAHEHSTGVGGRRPPRDGWPLTQETVKGRAAVLRCIGNAVVPELAAEFIRAYMEVVDGKR